MSDVPLVARPALVRTHRLTVTSLRALDLRLRLFASGVRLLRSTISGGVRTGAAVQRSPGVSLRIAVATRPVHDETDHPDNHEEHDERCHNREAYGYRRKSA